MACLKESEALAYVCGEIGAAERECIAAHVKECDTCRHLLADCQRIADDLSAQPGEFDDPSLTGDIMTLIDMGRAEPTALPTMVAKQRLLIPIAAAAAVALIVVTGTLLTLPSPKTDRGMTGITARGRDSTLDDWVSLELYRRDEQDREVRYLPIGDRIPPSAAVAVAYRDRSTDPFAYLMVFAVDHKGGIHWYYPAFSDDRENPVSITTPRTRQATLPDEVVHRLPEGPLTFFGLFSQTPLSVGEVESEVNRQLDARRDPGRIGRLNFEGCGQWSKSVTVVESMR